MIKDYTVKQLADEFNVSADALVKKLKEKGIEATPDEKLVEIEYKYDLDREEFKALLEEAIAELRGS
ncbi:translation initiation factor IF-2 N-terminal domain-containing protein [Thermococcus prieurii]